MWNSIDNTHPTGAILILQKWNECYKLYPYYKSDENDILKNNSKQSMYVFV